MHIFAVIGNFQTRYWGKDNQSFTIRRPSYQVSLDSKEDQINVYPSLVIGIHTRIGKDCVIDIEAALIGSSVYIWNGCGAMCHFQEGYNIGLLFHRGWDCHCCGYGNPAIFKSKGAPSKIVEEGLTPESFAVTYLWKIALKNSHNSWHIWRMAIYSDMENEGHHIISAYLLIATLDPVESRKSEYAESCLANPDVQPSIHWHSYLEPADLSRHSHEFNKRRNLYYKVCT